MFQKISFAVWSLKICWCLRVLDEAGGGGRMVYAEVGQELSLSCAYDLEEDVLHSLKWYRGDKEFYRYLPRDSSSPVTIYPLDGVSVSPRASPTLLVLDKVSSATNGVFKCEVSGGPPRFKTDVGVSIIQTIDLPEQGPRITGVVPAYSVGDSITAACLAPVSQPASRLRWYINHDTADPSFVSNQTTEVVTEDGPGLLILNAERSDFQDVVMRLRSPLKYDLESSAASSSVKDQYSPNLFSVSRLHFVIRDKQMRMGDGQLQLKCTASIENLYWRSAEVTAVIRTRGAGWLFSRAAAINEIILGPAGTATVILYFLCFKLN